MSVDSSVAWSWQAQVGSDATTHLSEVVNLVLTAARLVAQDVRERQPHLRRAMEETPVTLGPTCCPGVSPNVHVLP